jgi:hypothetical protein
MAAKKMLHAADNWPTSGGNFADVEHDAMGRRAQPIPNPPDPAEPARAASKKLVEATVASLPKRIDRSSVRRQAA